jgi:hypothetical protein
VLMGRPWPVILRAQSLLVVVSSKVVVSVVSRQASMPSRKQASINSNPIKSVYFRSKEEPAIQVQERFDNVGVGKKKVTSSCCLKGKVWIPEGGCGWMGAGGENARPRGVGARRRTRLRWWGFARTWCMQPESRERRRTRRAQLPRSEDNVFICGGVGKRCCCIS